MGIFDGKSPAERKKMIAAIVLGVLSIGSLVYAFGGSFFGSSRAASGTPTPSPRSSASPKKEIGEVKMPSQEEQDLSYMVPVVYDPSRSGSPDAGRNIFAFFEPPPPCPDCPTPVPPTPPIIIPTPTPPFPFELTFINPQSIFAGTNGTRIEITGERFTPDARVIFNNVELPTSYINAQRLSATVPANLIAIQGSAQIMVRTPDGSKYSLPFASGFSIQPPPTPQFKYVGMIARSRGNNDTAYFEEPGKQLPTGYRLNDVVSGRFRLVNITADTVTLQDTTLGFRHSVPMQKASSTGTTIGSPNQGQPFGRPGGVPAGFPQNPMQQPGAGQRIPGIPDNIPRYEPPNRRPTPNPNSPTKQPTLPDVDDEDTDNR